jgi:hypothetical protein
MDTADATVESIKAATQRLMNATLRELQARLCGSPAEAEEAAAEMAAAREAYDRVIPS